MARFTTPMSNRSGGSQPGSWSMWSANAALFVLSCWSGSANMLWSVGTAKCGAVSTTWRVASFGSIWAQSPRAFHGAMMAGSQNWPALPTRPMNGKRMP